MPYGLYQCKLININPYIAFKTSIYKPVHTTSNQKLYYKELVKEDTGGSKTRILMSLSLIILKYKILCFG